MKDDELDTQVLESLTRLLENTEVREALADSTDADRLLKALVKTGEFQSLLATIRMMTDNMAEANQNVLNIIETLKSHQNLIKNLMTIQDTLTKRARSSTLDTSLPVSQDKTTNKPN